VITHVGAFPVEKLLPSAAGAGVALVLARA
jgi:hypothetical protein